MRERGSSGNKMAWILASLFALAMVMGAGPGIHLVNRAETIAVGFGIRLPLLYAWALVWYAVQVFCIVMAYLYLWRPTEED